MKDERGGSSGGENLRTDDFRNREADVEPTSASDVSAGTGGRSVCDLLRTIQLRNVALLGVTVALFLVGFETVMRVFAPQSRYQPGGLVVPHPVRTFDLAPHSVRQESTSEFSVQYTLNEYGLKDYKIESKTSGTYRILCVGDSFTLGWGTSIDESYPKLLQKVLREELQDDLIEVINFSGFQYGVPHHLSKMRDLGFGLDPDLVILQLFPENDIQDTVYFVGKLMETNNVRRLRHVDKLRERMTVLGRVCYALRRHSHAFVFVYERWQTLKEDVGWLRGEMRDYPTIPGRPVYLESSLKEFYPVLKEGWHLNETYIREFRDECRSRGISLVAFEVPAKFELTEKMRRPLVEGAGADPGLYDFSKNWRLTNEILERLDIPYPDLRTALLATGHPEDYYWTEDVHMNVQGNMLIATLVKPFAIEQYGKWAGSGSEGQ